MSILSISGEPGCRPEDLARLLAPRLGYELLTAGALEQTLAGIRKQDTELPDRAWPLLAADVLIRRAAHTGLVYCLPGGQFLLRGLPDVFRVHLAASESSRIGAYMADEGLTRSAAIERLKHDEQQQAALNKLRFGRSRLQASSVSLTLNTESLDTLQQAAVVEAALRARGALDAPGIGAAAQAQMLFGIRLQLARFGISPPGEIAAHRPVFSHPSEEIFAKLLDFYRIPWEYEPRSFPLQWDAEGRVIEAFTPDFFLPEFDLYVELTTMKQALVTRKNHKIKLLRAIYPHINIQVFYQKDMQDLILKYEVTRSAGQVHRA
jgi:hypothetical protein